MMMMMIMIMMMVMIVVVVVISSSSRNLLFYKILKLAVEVCLIYLVQKFYSDPFVVISEQLHKCTKINHGIILTFH